MCVVENDWRIHVDHVAGGCLFLIDRRSCRMFRKDGHQWRKKAGMSVYGDWVCTLILGLLFAHNYVFLYYQLSRWQDGAGDA